MQGVAGNHIVTPFSFVTTLLLLFPASQSGSISTAGFLCSGVRCEYRSVIAAVLCPRISPTVFSGTPAIARCEAVCAEDRGPEAGYPNQSAGVPVRSKMMTPGSIL